MYAVQPVCIREKPKNSNLYDQLLLFKNVFCFQPEKKNSLKKSVKVHHDIHTHYSGK